MNKKPAFFFDRDGVLNELVGPNNHRGPRVFSELELVSGANTVIKDIRQLGFEIFVVTNQPDLSRGKLSTIENELIKKSICLHYGISRQHYFECIHDNHDSCACRKPKNGLIEKAIREFNIDREKSWIIGDKWSDISAGSSSKLHTILLKREYSMSSTSQGNAPDFLKADFEITTLSEITSCIHTLS